MTPAERRAALVEKVARAMWLADFKPYDPADRIPFDEAPEGARAYCLAEATAALTVALDEAARVAETHVRDLADSEDIVTNENNKAALAIAAAIRALIGKSDD